MEYRNGVGSDACWKVGFRGCVWALGCMMFAANCADGLVTVALLFLFDQVLLRLGRPVGESPHSSRSYFS